MPLNFPVEQLQAKLKSLNPWWETGKIQAFYDRLTPRPYLDIFESVAHEVLIRRAIILMGQRRVGKTVLLHHYIQLLINQKNEKATICYLPLDDPTLNGLLLEEIIDLAFTSQMPDYTYYVLFDEIQYVKDWPVQLKVLTDQRKNFRFIASGSAAAVLRRASNESGAGRFRDFILPPLSFYEYAELKNQSLLNGVSKLKEIILKQSSTYNELLFEYINYGGYPEALQKENQDAFRSLIGADIVDKVLLRDLPSLYGIQDVQELNKLFVNLAYNTGNEISYEGLSQNTHIDKATIKRYLQYLEAAFLIRIVHRIDNNAKRFQRATHFKVYLTNCSLRTALFNPVFQDDPEAGRMVETCLFANWKEADSLHYARWKDGEIDLVVLNSLQQPTEAVEIKWSDKEYLRPEVVNHLREFCRRTKLNKITITSPTELMSDNQEGININIFPAWYFIYMASWQRFIKDFNKATEVVKNVLDILEK